jgi:DNA-binding NtrC family response regulator
MTAKLPVILFVDDEEAILKSIVFTLRKEPYEVLTATSAVEASRILATTHVDVVVSDDRMPFIRGSELLRSLRSDYPDVIRIALTGEVDLQITSRVIREGEPYRFLSKPVSPDELKQTLTQALRVRHLHTHGGTAARDAAGPPRQP